MSSNISSVVSSQLLLPRASHTLDCFTDQLTEAILEAAEVELGEGNYGNANNGQETTNSSVFQSQFAFELP